MERKRTAILSLLVAALLTAPYLHARTLPKSPTPETCQLPSTEAPSDCPRCYDEVSGGVSVSGDPAVYVPNFAGPVDFRVFYLSENYDIGDIGRSWRTRIFQIRNSEGKPIFRLDADKRGYIIVGGLR
ncbi:MAG: hypothetical protein WC421_09550 [Elusimicrobiales bacterium]